jgi:lathosterol oxidase
MDLLNAVKEILISLPKGIISGIMLTGSVVSIAYFIFWKKYKQRFKNWRIQVKERVDANQLKHELKNSIVVFIVGALFSGVILYLNTKGYTKIYTNFSDHSPFWSIGCFFILLLIDDAWFYWVHRLLHHPKLFPYVHVVHHKSIDVNPFTSVSFHWVEALLLTLWIFPVSFIFPIYAPMLGFLQLWGLLDNVKSHLGYELYPAKFNKSWLRFLTSSTYHNMHHSKFKGNYGVHFRIWDKLFGTEFKDYESEYDKIQERKKLKPILTALLLFISLSVFSQSSNSIVGNWKDKSHPEKQVQMYVGTNDKIYGKAANNTIVFKALVWDNATKKYNGILINPDNKEEFKISISLSTNDTFSFTVKKFIFSKKFQFVRI